MNHDTALTRPALYHPALWSRDEVRTYYVARHRLLDRFLDDFRREKPGTRPQHRLILGQRGMEAIQHAIDEQAVASEFKARVDELLDVYSAWRQSGDPELIRVMRELVATIRQLDPGFQFDLPE